MVTGTALAWIVGELALHAAFGTSNLGAGSFISFGVWLGCVAVLWASVTWAAALGLISVSVSLAVGLMPVQEVLFLIVMSGAVALYSSPFLRRTYLGLTLVWTVWFAGHVESISAAVPLALLVGLLLVLAYGIGRAGRGISEKRDTAQQELLEAEAHHQQALTAQRRALARELHDIVAHDVTVMAMQAEAADISGDDAQQKAALGTIQTSARAALRDLRRMVKVLQEDGAIDDASETAEAYPDAVFPDSLSTFLMELRLGGVAVDVDITGDWEAVAYSTRHSLHQIMRECVVNVLKYGSTAAGVKEPHCEIAAHACATEVRLRVANCMPSGGHPAADEDFSTGFGLIGIRDRVETFGGELSVGPDGAGQWVCEVRGLGAAI